MIVDTTHPPGKAAAVETFVITLWAEPSDSRPPIIGLRQLLKLAKRGFHLQCIAAVPSVEEVQP
ncbi:MAG: hypothetical protein SH850_30965 [Planctomycetaceae bacterium]|nr:hypothetical protein [Planctomycetaceae bacterium]